MSDAPIGLLKKLTPGRRLAAMLATLAAFQLAVAAGLPEEWIYAIPVPPELGVWRYLACLQWMTARLSGPMFTTFSFAVAVVAILALAVRAARGATPGSARDPLMTVRDFFRDHPRLATLLTWVPTVLFVRTVVVNLQAEVAWRDPWWVAPLYVGYPLALLLCGGVLALLGRQVLRMLTQLPDAAPAATEAVTTVDRAEPSFQAVAVTGRTTGAVLAVAALALTMTVAVATSNLWILDTAHGAPLAGYFAVLIGTALWFRKASTIAVGRDGVLVRGTSKEHFHAYSAFDEVRLAGVHLDLMRDGKRVLRLQLHGPDAARAEALGERIRFALAQSHRTDGARLLAQSAAAGSLHRAAQGATDYREVSLTREQLWELVEGEATDPQARLAAAGALATSIDGEERARLRIAAHHVADPKVRVTLEELADESADDRDAATAPRALVKDGAFT